MTPTLDVIHGDITTLAYDVIVNAANSTLLGGGGVDGAIHRAGGPAILHACRQIRQTQGSCPTGQAVITTAGELPARFVIHTVGPIWQGGECGEAALLASCYRECLRLALVHHAQSIAFPSISTGVYRFPKAQACQIATDTVREFFCQHGTTTLQKVAFVCFDETIFGLYKTALQ